MTIARIANPTVKAAVDALQSGNRQVSTSEVSVQIFQRLDNVYNCAQATDCVPRIQQFGTRPKSRHAANCALNMSAVSVQKRTLSAFSVQIHGEGP